MKLFHQDYGSSTILTWTNQWSSDGVVHYSSSSLLQPVPESCLFLKSRPCICFMLISKLLFNHYFSFYLWQDLPYHMNNKLFRYNLGSTKFWNVKWMGICTSFQSYFCFSKFSRILTNGFVYFIAKLWCLLNFDAVSFVIFCFWSNFVDPKQNICY